MPTNDTSAKAFLGVGWNFPLRQQGDHTATASYEEDIRQAIRIILLTNPGERVMRPDFGAGLNAFLFEPINPTSMQQLQTQVQNALVSWEPRINVISVTVSAPDSYSGQLLIDINYQVLATNAVANLVYPFFLQESSQQ